MILLVIIKKLGIDFISFSMRLIFVDIFSMSKIGINCMYCFYLRIYPWIYDVFDHNMISSRNWQAWRAFVPK